MDTELIVLLFYDVKFLVSGRYVVFQIWRWPSIAGWCLNVSSMCTT